MRIYRLLSTAMGGIFVAGLSTAAYAGCGNYGTSYNCNPGVVTHPVAVNQLAPVNVYSYAPYGHLKSVAYKNTPNVNIMRLHSRAPLVNLSDTPVGFTGGCAPSSTAYCRSGGTTPQINVAPAPMPMAPITPTRTPRIYGSLDFVPGIAHVPTSIVDRSPITHIDGVPQPQVGSVTTMAMRARSYVAPAPVLAPAPMTMPMPRAPRGNLIGNVMANQYTYQPAGGGAYWEKTSGPTIVDGLPATQILCRRQAPRPAPVTVKVVRPVYGVTHAVPTPVAVPRPTPMCSGPNPALAGGPVNTGATRYGSRWSY